MGAWPFSSGRASRARGQLGLDILFDMGDARAGKKEDAQKHEGEVPWVNGVSDACQCCGDEPGGCKRVLGIGAIDHQPKGWRCDGGLHVGSDRRLWTAID